jgi:hypothetical protein
MNNVKRRRTLARPVYAGRGMHIRARALRYTLRLT